jgi:biopolymer transport protein ExbD
MAHIPSGGKPGNDVEINIVPMIDLMSCLTAFLLLTAVWSTTMALNTKPSGKGPIAAADEFPIIELAAESTDAEPVRYDTMIAAMDSVVRAGFPSVGLTDPASLTLRPTL